MEKWQSSEFSAFLYCFPYILNCQQVPILLCFNWISMLKLHLPTSPSLHLTQQEFYLLLIPLEAHTHLIPPLRQRTNSPYPPGKHRQCSDIPARIVSAEQSDRLSFHLCPATRRLMEVVGSRVADSLLHSLPLCQREPASQSGAEPPPPPCSN